ncbi:deleted in malignant brain tumors 1 protein-like, partial [Dendronephthya gigantea]|uniref:deleted in malignant brain tumors 1 protein-like n=1 Tax=Dendronephthya gigantea TaxID=151771 RepID=UPI00106C6728
MSLAIITGVIFGLHFVSHHCEAITAPIRLQGPRSANGTGRVEVFYNGTWGTICNDGWDIRDARVVCRQLGYIDSGMVLYSSWIFSGSGKIWLKNVDCTGEEETITSCSHNGWGVSDSCNYFDDVRVECLKTAVPLRLQGPSSLNGTGRVEVFYNGRWGTIGDDNWDMKDARVVCRQLGYKDVARALHGGQVPSGSEKIWLSGMDCTGEEPNITGCFHRRWGSPYWRHSNDAGVECTKTDFSDADVPLRLQGPLSENGTGRVEVFYHGYWGTICDYAWSMKDARVACRQLGYQDVLRALRGTQVPSASGQIWLSDVECTGKERNITSCTHRGWGVHFCSHSDDVGVECSTQDLTDTPVRLRLQGPSSANGSGRVEILYHGYWGTICDHGWNMRNARVVCRQLGYQDVARTLQRNEFSSGSGDIWLNRLDCTGLERNITSCRHTLWGEHRYCSHDDDVGVECSTTDFTSIPVRLRLRGPLSENGTGRVEILYHGYWAKMSGYYWNKRNAKVACRQLGYNPDNATTLKRNLVLHSPGPMWYGNIDCTGHEQNITNCYHDDFKFTSEAHPRGGIAGVQCSPTDFTAIPLRLRLQGPMSANGSGRVEVFYYGQWGTICRHEHKGSKGWPLFTRFVANASYRVICRQLGYYDAVRALQRDEVPLGSGRIWLDSIDCSGNEEKIENCSLSSWGDNHCSHENDVGVECTAN